MARCTICDKKAVSGSNVSHSQVHTKRRFKPNLQKVSGLVLCTKCLRTIKKIAGEESAKLAEAQEQKTESANKIEAKPSK